MAAEQTEPGQTNEKRGLQESRLEKPRAMLKTEKCRKCGFFFSITFVFNVNREPIADVYGWF